MTVMMPTATVRRETREARPAGSAGAAAVSATAGVTTAWAPALLTAGKPASLLDAHLIADGTHALDTARDFDGMVDLSLVIDKTAQLDFTLAGGDGDVETLDARIGDERGLDPGGHDAVIDFVAHGAVRVFQAHFVFDAAHARHRTGNFDRAIDMRLIVHKAAQLDFALARIDFEAIT